MYYKSAWNNFCLHVILRWWYRKIESISRSLENASSSNLRLLKSLYFSDSPPPLGLLGRKFLLHRMYRTHSLIMAVELFLSLLEHCTCPFCLGWGGGGTDLNTRVPGTISASILPTLLGPTHSFTDFSLFLLHVLCFILWCSEG